MHYLSAVYYDTNILVHVFSSGNWLCYNYIPTSCTTLNGHSLQAGE